MRVRASHAEAERPRLFPLSQGQYVCEIRSRTFPQLGQLSAAQQGLSRCISDCSAYHFCMPCIIDKSRKADALAEMWSPHFCHVLAEMWRLFLSSRTVAWSLTHIGFWTLEANLKKRMSYLVLGPKRLTYLYQQLHCHLENKKL